MHHPVTPQSDSAFRRSPNTVWLVTGLRQFLLYVEYVTGALHIEEDSEVRACRLNFDWLGVEALSPDDSVALSKRISQER